MHPHMHWFHTLLSQHSMCAWPVMAHMHCTLDDVISLHTINCSPVLLAAEPSALYSAVSLKQVNIAILLTSISLI
jgi:hypothetical protein